MVPANFKVVIDANALYPCSLRDTLLRCAEGDLFQLYWSEEILDETRRNLVKNGECTKRQGKRLVKVMKKAFPEALVKGHEVFIPAMKNEKKDRHVAAAAVKAGATLIVTSNLRDFRKLPPGLTAQSPDEFLENLFDLYPDEVLAILHEQAEDLDDPPIDFETLIGGLERQHPRFIAAVRGAVNRVLLDRGPGEKSRTE